MMFDEIVKRLRELQVITEHCAEQSCDECENRKLCDKYDNKTLSGTYKEAADVIEELNSENKEIMFRANQLEAMNDAKPCWIPVTETERLPEKNGSYLVYVYGEVTEMNYWHGKWHRLGDDYTQAVTHWMPMPEPPKEKEET